MKLKSMKTNLLVNGIRILSTIIFPLITFPYASRVLQVENLGKVNFTNSLISYFIIIASLGLPTYAIREGSRIRNNKEEFGKFANQIFTFNLLSSMIAYIGLFVLIPVFKDYRLLLLIQSITIIFNTIGVEWLYSIHEDYTYITIRSIIFQIISLVLLFIFVKEPSDYYIYASISVFSNVGSNILNYVNSRKYVRLKLIKSINFGKHIIPVLIIFSTSIATTFYVNSDMTMLGLILDDYAVGIYSVSVRIYSIVKMLLSSILIVTLPRLSFHLAQNNKIEYKKLLDKIFNTLILVVLPSIIGINILSSEIIMIISGKAYLEATSSLRLLTIALFFSTLASFFATAVLLPNKKEKYILHATIISAVVNVLMNVLLIPIFKQDGAAFTTVIAEMIVLIITFYFSKAFYNIRDINKNVIISLIGCITIFTTALIIKAIFNEMIVYVPLTIFFSILSYYIILLIFKVELAQEATASLFRKIKK